MIELRPSVLLLFFICSFLLTVSGFSIRSVRGVALSTFKLTRITQQSTETGHRVQLHLEGSILPRVFMGSHQRKSLEAVEVPSNGVVQLDMKYTNADILFLHPRGYQTCSIYLTEETPSEQLVPEMGFFSQEGKEITFQRGNDVDVNVSFSIGSGPNKVDFADFRYSLSVKSKSEEHVVENYYADNEQSPLEVIDETITHLHIETASGDVEGLLGLDSFIVLDCAQGCIVNHYRIHEDVPVYQDDHDGPFPEGFIGFLKDRYDESLTQEFCSVYKSFSCGLRCEFVGDHPSPVEFVRVDGPGEEVSVESQVHVSNRGFRALGQVILLNFTSSQAGTYQCKSRSGSEEVRHTIALIATHDATINHSLSTVNTFDNGTVEVTCIAEGKPMPTISFYNGLDGLIDDVNSEHYDIIVTQLDDTTSKVVLRINDAADASSPTSVSCVADNEIHGRHYSDAAYFQLGNTNESLVNYYLGNFVEGP